jgi:hypothetical protein
LCEERPHEVGIRYALSLHVAVGRSVAQLLRMDLFKALRSLWRMSPLTQRSHVASAVRRTLACEPCWLGGLAESESTRTRQTSFTSIHSTGRRAGEARSRLRHLCLMVSDST